MKFDRDNSVTWLWVRGSPRVPMGHKSLLNWKDFWLALCLGWCAFLMELFLRATCTLMSPGKSETSLSHVLGELGWECLCIQKFKEYMSLMICWIRNVKNLCKNIWKNQLCRYCDNNHNIKPYWKAYGEYAV